MSGEPAVFIPFRLSQEIIRICGYTLPSFALILYLLGIKGESGYVTRKPQSRDFLSLVIALPGLIGISMGVSFIAPLFQESPPGITIESPRGIGAWLVMLLSCISTGYLEETFFRHYLITCFSDADYPRPLRLILPILLFSLCHLYEGPWGVLNATLAGILLSVLYSRNKTLHGLAWAHGLYNAFVFIIGA